MKIVQLDESAKNEALSLAKEVLSASYDEKQTEAAVAVVIQDHFEPFRSFGGEYRQVAQPKERVLCTVLTGRPAEQAELAGGAFRPDTAGGSGGDKGRTNAADIRIV